MKFCKLGFALPFRNVFFKDVLQFREKRFVTPRLVILSESDANKNKSFAEFFYSASFRKSVVKNFD